MQHLSTVTGPTLVHAKPRQLRRARRKAAAQQLPMGPRRVVVYCHDLFGVGNMRRMLRLCRHLLDADARVQVLLLSGNPGIHRFALPDRLEHVKLPCLTRDLLGDVRAKRLPELTSAMLQLRAEMILSAVRSMKPDLLLVDKKPRGACNELDSTIEHLERELKRCRRVLVLRDILDAPATTRRLWARDDAYRRMDTFYDRIVVVGDKRVFDVGEAYALSPELEKKVRYCGYMHISEPLRSRKSVLGDCRLDPSVPTVLLTVGGGEDGGRILKAYLDGLERRRPPFQSLIVAGPELPDHEYQQLKARVRKYPALKYPRVVLSRFCDDMLALMHASDVAVSMAGYNTVCELLSLRKPTVVVPRGSPTMEQQMRAERMAELGWVETVAAPLEPSGLMQAVERQLARSVHAPAVPPEATQLDFPDTYRRCIYELFA